MEEHPAVSLVAAVAKNGVIGAENDMPWRLSTDLRRFKSITMGKPVIMGRKTWESIGRPLPGRTNIVVSRDDTYQAVGAKVVTSLPQAIAEARNFNAEVEEICVIGGGQIYREAISIAERLYITHVEAAPAGDTRFPIIDQSKWKLIHEEALPDGEKDDFASRFAVYHRLGRGG